MIVEVIKIAVSALTPILIFILGLKVIKKFERKKIEVLKEKEFQVKWAELFLSEALDFNDSVTTIVCSIFWIQTAGESEVERIEKECVEAIRRLQATDWNIQNYTQFAKKTNSGFLHKQKELSMTLSKIIKEKKGNLEEVRSMQTEYNILMRKVYSEILESQ